MQQGDLSKKNITLNQPQGQQWSDLFSFSQETWWQKLKVAVGSIKENNVTGGQELVLENVVEAEHFFPLKMHFGSAWKLHKIQG